MTDKRSRILIIDASVAKAAGGKDAVDPLSIQCSDFLTAVFRICHKIGISRDIYREWTKHASPFSSRWLTNMKSRRKYIPVKSENNAYLRNKIFDGEATLKDKKNMEKDAILIEAALKTDGIVISLDETARGLFQNLSLNADELNNICWINPTNKSEKPIQWLKAGALSEKNRTFEHRRKKKITTKKAKKHTK